MTNAEFIEDDGTRAAPADRGAGAGLRRCAWCSGEFAGEVLGGQRAVPAALTAAGFEFEHTDVESGLRWALGR